jgi:hypothetical protein
MIYGSFLHSFSLWYLISERQKISFFVFCCFRYLQELKKLRDFYSVNNLSQDAAGALDSHERSRDAQMGMGGLAHLPDRATRACLAVEHRLGSVLLYTHPSQKKNYAQFFLELSEAEVEPFLYMYYYLLYSIKQ